MKLEAPHSGARRSRVHHRTAHDHHFPVQVENDLRHDLPSEEEVDAVVEEEEEARPPPERMILNLQQLCPATSRTTPLSTKESKRKP
jgi:hypothetical protein